MAMKDVLKQELELIRVPNAEVSRLKKLATEFIKSLGDKGLKAFIGGSLAKGTLVAKSKQDVDIFVVFEYSEDISKLGGILKKMKLPGALSLVHGSRDYFHVDCGDAVLEVIPVVANKDPEMAENITDISLSHVKYVSSEIKKNPSIADEIRLAKAFARAQKCYGAEGYVRGFSGYSLEILVIYFGGFVKFLKGISKKRIVDPLKYFRNEKEVMREINSSKLQGPVVLVDPTYKYRNVCAGLGLSTFEKFLEISDEFLKKPSVDFFKKKEIDVNELEEFARGKKARFLKLKLSTDRQEGDIAGTKMKKLFNFFVRELVRNGQNILRSEFDYSGKGSEAVGYLVVLEHELVEVRGPSVGLEEAVLKFKKAKDKEMIFKRKGFWWWKKKVSVEEVLKRVKGVECEMGARINLLK